MKTHMFALAAFLMVAMGAQAQTVTLAQHADSAITVMKLKSLEQQRQRLTKEIKDADAKRNQKLEGVTPEDMEAINDRQDSICLDLRSQLVDVELQITELKRKKK